MIRSRYSVSHDQVIDKREGGREGEREGGGGRERVLTKLCLTCSEADDQMRGREERRQGMCLVS